MRTTITCLGLILNLIKRHPKTIELIHKQAVSNQKGDPYDETAKDPVDSKATETSLWELEFLQQYF